MTWYDNRLEKFADSTRFAIKRKLRKIVFTYDYVLAPIKTFPGSPPDLICGLLQKHYKRTRTVPMRFSNSKAWRGWFNKKTYFDPGDGAYIRVLTERARAIKHYTTLITVYNARPKHLRMLHQILSASQYVQDYWPARIEFTFDFFMRKKRHVARLKKYLRRTCYFRYGRVAFSYGTRDDYSDYIGSRKSIKQSRVYKEPQDYRGNRKNYHRILRWEININKAKAKRIGLKSFVDLIDYDLGILEEIKLYDIMPHETWQSLFAFRTKGYFCDLLGAKLSKKGFMSALIWARSEIVGCPNNCDYDGFGCPAIVLDADSDGRKRFEAIQGCKHARPFKNFLRLFAYEDEYFRIFYRRAMQKAFQKWKKPKP